MADFETYSLDTVADEGREILETVNEAYGFVPNLMGKMVESPELARAYLDIGKTFDRTSFSETERQVVLLAVSRFNECEYCVAAHSAIAGMGKVPGDVVNAIRKDEPIADSRLEALRQFVTKAVERRGWVDASDVDAFFDAGYGHRQLLEVFIGIAMKTMSNYTNHVAGTELDDAFDDHEWRIPGNRAA